jgi:hypothetical protein
MYRKKKWGPVSAGGLKKKEKKILFLPFYGCFVI